MSRKWSKSQRQAQSRRLKSYWRTVHRIQKSERVPLSKAKEFYKSGIFRGRAIAEATGKRVFERYQIRRDKSGRVYIVRELPSGEIKRISQATVEKAKNLTTYNVMVSRLSQWTGWDRSKVRTFLSRYPQWREGVSPLFRKRR